MLYADAVAKTDARGITTWSSETVDEIDTWLTEAADAVKALEALDDAEREIEAMSKRVEEAATTAKPLLKARLEALRAKKKRLPKPKPPERVVEIGQERLAHWARDRIWRVDESDRCTLEQPSTPDDAPECEVERDFFRTWAEKLGWTDHEMLYGIAAGVDSHAECELTTVLRFHHKGLQRNFGPARESTDGRPFTPSHFRSLVKRVAARLGYDPAHFGGHSPRIGGATDIGDRNPLMLQAKGRWAGDIARIYNRLTRRGLVRASRAMHKRGSLDMEELYADFAQPA